MRDPKKGRVALRRGRVSVAGGEYFLTICTDQRRTGLTATAVAARIIEELHALVADGTWRLRCAVVMPDHLHVLAVLGHRLSLGRAVARLKARTAGALRSCGLEWERDFFDRHVRPGEDRVAIFRYLYLNPHRAGLCGRDERWPEYFCGEEDWGWFRNHLTDDGPPPEWLA